MVAEEEAEQDKDEAELKKLGQAVLLQYRLSRPMPDAVHHYTSLDVAEKIARTRIVRAGNVAYTNDPTENAYGERLLRSVVRKDPVLALKGVFKVLRELDCYAVSFSAEPDLLPQWRAYCRNGKGVAVGVSTDALIKRKSMVFMRVEYEPKRQRRLVRDMLDAFRPVIVANAANTNMLAKAVGVLAIYLVILRAAFKSAAYESERDYRLFDVLPKDRSAHHTTLSFRPTTTLLVPYFEVDLTQTSSPDAAQAIKQLRVGPCLDFALASHSFELVAVQHSLKFSVVRSNVRMRCE